MSDITKCLKKYSIQFRLEHIYSELKKLNLDGLLVSSQPNITYLTGFPSRDSYILISKKCNFFITDFRYIEEAKNNIKGFSIQKINGSVFTLLANLSKRIGLKRLGFEAKHLAFAEYQKIKEGLSYNSDFVSTDDLIEKIRQIKENREIQSIKTAIQVTVEAIRYAKSIIKEGLREAELAAKIEYFIKNKGLGIAFDIIVASGQNSSFPHHITSLRKLKNNEPILVDIGVDYLGYKSNLTRVFFLGKITPTFRRIYNIVLKAQAQAIKAIGPAVPINKIDKAARQYIAQKRYARFFGHNLGHGIGLEVHEEPHICPKNNHRLIKGMIFTVEPAIYLPERFGVRIEDIVLVTKKGGNVLSDNLDRSI